MNDYQKIINKIIPADDLHWCEEEKRYIPISMEDIDKIIINCVNQGITDMDDIIKVIRWAEVVNVGNILLKNLLSDKVAVIGFDENEPLFGEK